MDTDSTAGRSSSAFLLATQEELRGPHAPRVAILNGITWSEGDSRQVRLWKSTAPRNVTRRSILLVCISVLLRRVALYGDAHYNIIAVAQSQHKS
eukprot:11294-Heterococcus_DN1.PRE.1